MQSMDCDFNFGARATMCFSFLIFFFFFFFRLRWFRCRLVIPIENLAAGALLHYRFVCWDIAPVRECSVAIDLLFVHNKRDFLKVLPSLADLAYNFQASAKTFPGTTWMSIRMLFAKCAPKLIIPLRCRFLRPLLFHKHEFPA